jgi:hypothetical protein
MRFVTGTEATLWRELTALHLPAVKVSRQAK